MDAQEATNEWQRLHALWVRAVDDNDRAEADRLLAECDKLLPLFSKYTPTIADRNIP